VERSVELGRMVGVRRGKKNLCSKGWMR